MSEARAVTNFSGGAEEPARLEEGTPVLEKAAAGVWWLVTCKDL